MNMVRALDGATLKGVSGLAGNEDSGGSWGNCGGAISGKSWGSLQKAGGFAEASWGTVGSWRNFGGWRLCSKLGALQGGVDGIVGGLGLTVGLRALRGPRGTVGVHTDNYGRLGDLQVTGDPGGGRPWPGSRPGPRS